MAYALGAKMKLLDTAGNPFACDKNAIWGTALTSPQMTIKVNHPTEGMKEFHIQNLFSDPWVEDWNDYRGNINITPLW